MPDFGLLDWQSMDKDRIKPADPYTLDKVYCACAWRRGGGRREMRQKSEGP